MSEKPTKLHIFLLLSVGKWSRDLPKDRLELQKCYQRLPNSMIRTQNKYFIYSGTWSSSRKFLIWNFEISRFFATV